MVSHKYNVFKDLEKIFCFSSVFLYEINSRVNGQKFIKLNSTWILLRTENELEYSWHLAKWKEALLPDIPFTRTALLHVFNQLSV